jgi:S1-C subfamily serine protease
MAQDAVPTDIMRHTLMIKSGNGFGTAFEISHHNHLYLVTARHVVPDIPTENAVVQYRVGNEWKDLQTKKTIFPLSADVDIAIFDLDQTSNEQFYVNPMEGESGPTFGQQVWFLGYPFGIESELTNKSTLPFLKRGIMSAVDSRNLGAVVFYIDGFNNPGFSGGPVIFFDFKSHEYKILSVVKGYINDTAKTIANKQQVDTSYLVNSGIMISYSITNALEAINLDLGAGHQ